MQHPVPIPLVHVATWAWTLGGVQSDVAHHAARDARLGFVPRVVGLFDRAAPAGAAATLGARAWTGIAAARRRFRQLAEQGGPGRVMLYHDGWGLPWWADVDGAFRRVLYLHTEDPQLEHRFRRIAGALDGVLAVNRSMLDRVQRAVPDFPAERCWKIPYFVDPPMALAALSGQREKIWRVGFAGRLARAHKRVDRLPLLVAELDRTGLDYRFEIMGEGEYESELRRALGGHTRVAFLGRRTGTAYWSTLTEWDCQVLPSDFEGFGRVMMEGMMVGNLPVMPEYSPAAAEVLGPLTEQGLYPVGDMAAAAGRVRAYAEASDAKRLAWREAGRARFAGHRVADYEAAFGNALRRIAALPARGRPEAPAGWEILLPLGLHTRLFSRRF